MAEQKFNEAEQYLLEHWVAASEVEESMAEVRNKYQSLCDQIVGEVRESHPELDRARAEVNRIGGALKSGGMVFSRSTWPCDGEKWLTGFWVENLRLEVLADNQEEEPTVGLWLMWNDDASNDFYNAAAKAIQDAAKTRMNSEVFQQWKTGDGYDTPVIGRRIAPKHELLKMLSGGNTEQFVETIVEQLEQLAALIPDIDAALGKNVKAARN